MTDGHAGSKVEEKGSAFFVVTILALTATVIVGAYLSSSLGKVRHVETRVATGSVFNAAESGLNAGIEAVWTRYRLAAPHLRLDEVDRLDGKYDAAEQLVITDRIGSATFTARVVEVRVVDGDYADVEISARADDRRASHTLGAVVRYGRMPSRVFNYAYFINNFGWLWGSSITVNGDVRSNGNFSLKDATVNGDVYASENAGLGAAGTVTGASVNDAVADYNAAGDTRARPTDPSAPSEDADGDGQLDPGEDANGNGVLDTYEYPGGYDGDSERHEGQAPIDMPWLGDLDVYRALATSKGGTISQGGVTVVDGVLGDSVGESDHVILEGTAANPIVIDGPVVIEGDVVLKGVITGQGTIYAGRNVHVVGDLTYANPPEWSKPMTDREGTKAANATKDLVGLAAKGSVVLGDYTASWWKSATGSYQKPPFTSPYEVDPTDAANGYVSYLDAEGRPIFDGDYTALDGGTKDDGAGGTTGRRFYESSFSDSTIHALAGSEYVTRIDAVLYTNHMLSGRVGECEVNGTLVSRDEAIIYSGSLTMNYDVRVRDDGYENIDIFLPREPTYRIVYWTEASPQ